MEFDESVRVTTRIGSTTPIPWNDVVRAYQGRAWEALGYTCWEHYATGLFQGGHPNLTPEERVERVLWLREKGMPVRAIAAVTGENKPATRRAKSNGLRVTDGTGRSPNRRALPMQFRKPVVDMSRAARRFAELMQDDRFRANRANIAREYGPQLRIAYDELSALINAIDE